MIIINLNQATDTLLVLLYIHKVRYNRVDKASNSLEQSLVATNDLSLDGAVFASTKTNDEVDNNDPFYKRRYDY